VASSTNPPYSKGSFTDRLQEYPLFWELSPESLKALDNIILSMSYATGAILFSQGQPASGVFIIASGRVKLVSVTRGGLVDMLAIAKVGEAIGLSATVSSRPYLVTATTMEMTETVFVHRDSFLDFIQKHVDAAVRVAQVLAELHQVSQEENKRCLTRGSTPQKLARLVLNLAAQQREDGDRLNFLLTHEEIGQIIGTARETVTRALGDLKNRKILAFQKSMLMIRNRSALRRIADA
jgi:CRP/FNR family transcriptional regulator, cyclic AMP receptor protein